MTRLRRALCATSATLITAALAISVPTTVSAAESDELPDGTHTTKTLVIGIDGASFDFLEPSALPVISRLRAEGTTSVSDLYASPMAQTSSGPGWSTIATGVWPDKHNVVDNSFADPHYDQYPDYLTRIEAADAAASTAVVGTWAPVPETIFGDAVDVRISGGNDDGTTARAVDLLANGNPDDVFVHLDEVDGAGHSVGTNGPAYGEALRRADAQIGEMLAAIDSRATAADEEWLVIITSDHGHKPTGGHGGNTLPERETFVIAAGAGVPAGVSRNDVKLVDIAPMVLAANGIARDAAWELDGSALEDLMPDVFDTLRPQLQAQVDETRPGAGLLGWTHTTPDGWSIDNSRMPEGGVTEWRGWSFASDEFWTNVEAGQLREASVRNRDVFAVADSDEWDDKAHAPGPFDSTLVSPAWPLTGAATATLSYATHYFIDGPQSAEVLVSFDGGAAQPLKTYKIDTNRVERLEFDVPAGATTAQFSFHYTGTNSAFWTVDQVALAQEEAPEPVLPGAPGAVRATAGDAAIRVAWTAPAGDVPVTGYTATATPVDAAARAAAPTCTTTGTSCDITGLSNGTAYRVSVVAHGEDGDSVAAELAAAVTPVAADSGSGSGPGEENPGGSGGSDPSGEAGGSEGDGADGAGELATTGADSMPFVVAGSVVLLLGAVLAVLGLRRRLTQE